MNSGTRSTKFTQSPVAGKLRMIFQKRMFVHDWSDKTSQAASPADNDDSGSEDRLFLHLISKHNKRKNASVIDDFANMQ